MTNKEYLKQYKVNSEKSKRVRRQIVAVIDDSPDSFSLQFISELEDMEQESLDICRQIIKGIEQLSDETEKQILYYRYIDGMKWHEIEQKMNYSNRQILRIHKQALINFKQG